MIKPLILLLFLAVASGCSTPMADSNDKILISGITLEEARLEKLKSEHPELANQFQKNISNFDQAIRQSENWNELHTQVQQHSNKLWQDAIAHLQAENNFFDDRALYWARLQFSTLLKSNDYKFELSPEQFEQLFWSMERATRGQKDINFSKNSDKKILITGFDPFFLDKNIGQSNPSGLAANALDGKKFLIDGTTIEIQSAIFPVRFIDFDLGEVERFLSPFYQDSEIDMIATISMGREHFDLERFPGLRRSSVAPDNLNVFTGANAENPIIPNLKEETLQGFEFVEFSLPVQAMQKASGEFDINDNHEVTTLEKNYHPKSYSELEEAIAVEGSGGGYLSNEISYRSINLRNKLQSSIPTGHIHTPRVQGFEPEIERKIVEQIEQMLIQGALSL